MNEKARESSGMSARLIDERVYSYGVSNSPVIKHAFTIS